MTKSLPALPAVGPFFQNFVAQAKAFPQSLKTPQMAKKIEDHAFNVLLAVGALACSRSNKVPFAVGAVLSLAVQIKHKEIMAQVTKLAPQYLTLGDNKLGMLSLFVPSDAKPETHQKTTANIMLALMITYLTSSWLGAKVTATLIGYNAVQQLYKLTQNKSDKGDEVQGQGSKPVARQLEFPESGIMPQVSGSMFGTPDAQGDA